ncbi:hypothetical protein [Microvirga makkahensis]|uniref:Uncharacterized protein n=1 Tax=Microvirga makkahensis TaxID=1128670 RepID=A0A7X3MTV2_9HYPH|nr:hypothetical protein [Microvirga makkahensis]MXQ13104.1 hypothetical protein [Microvirga makkahensis]
MSMTAAPADPVVAFTGTTTSSSDPLAPLKSQIVAALSSPGSKSIIGPSASGQFGGAQRDSAIAACSLFGSLAASLAQNPNLISQVQPTISKAYTTPALQDSSRMTDKAWWNDVLSVVQQAAPIALQIFNAVSGGRKDFNAVVNSPAAQRHANDKDWQNFVADVLTQVTPMLVHALRGTKDFTQPGAVTLNIRPPANIQGDQKGWFDDAMSFVGDALPVVLPIVMSLI